MRSPEPPEERAIAEELSHDQRARLARRLAARLAALDRLDAAGEGWTKPVALDQQSVGRLSRMDAIQQQAMAEAEARRRRVERQRIAAAMARIDDSEYGWCSTCGEPIGDGRLTADPAAHRCVGCAE